MTYTVKKALACRRWDLIVNGEVICSRDSAWELDVIIQGFIVKGYLLSQEV